jgi:hypothetical protein
MIHEKNLSKKSRDTVTVKSGRPAHHQVLKSIAVSVNLFVEKKPEENKVLEDALEFRCRRYLLPGYTCTPFSSELVKAGTSFIVYTCYTQI